MNSKGFFIIFNQVNLLFQLNSPSSQSDLKHLLQKVKSREKKGQGLYAKNVSEWQNKWIKSQFCIDLLKQTVWTDWQKLISKAVFFLLQKHYLKHLHA